MNKFPPFNPQIYRGYYIAFVVFLATGLAIGMGQYSFGEFSAPLREKFGWTQTQLNLSLSFAFISGILAPFIGRISDSIGVRSVVAMSLLCMALGFGLRPFISQLWHWYLFSALVYAGFPGATILPVGKLVHIWFPETTGRVSGAVTSGNNFGGIVMPPFAAFMIIAFGWEWAYVGFGVLMAALAIIAYFVISESKIDVQLERVRTGRDKTHNQTTAIDQGLTLRQAVSNRAFWLLMFGLTAATFTYQGVLTQLRQHFGENGFEPAAATAAITTIAVMGIGSKLIFGRIAEGFPARKATIISLAFQAIGVFLMSSSSGINIMWVGIIIFSLGFGGLGVLLILVVQQTFGQRSFGSIIGWFQTAQIISGAGAPILAGIIHDATGSFNLAFRIIVVIFLIGMITLWWTPQPKLQID